MRPSRVIMYAYILCARLRAATDRMTRTAPTGDGATAAERSRAARGRRGASAPVPHAPLKSGQQLNHHMRNLLHALLAAACANACKPKVHHAEERARRRGRCLSATCGAHVTLRATDRVLPVCRSLLYPTFCVCAS